ncbi:MAG: RNA 2',3'-cyclic phosphodiesterase [Myxococcota bacterium]|nr:RNA 2',3'-cyclic phosphodiesterase [Myxococcota bacterium]
MSHGEGGIRAFIAVDLDDTARAATASLLARLREGGGRGVRWVRPEALHVTLFFLGNIAPEQVAPLARSVSAEVAPLAPFALELGEVHLFPSPRRARVVALDVAPEDALSELAAAVQRGVVAEGFEPEDRPFRAHLTLGRIKTGRAPATRGLTAGGASCQVSEVVLFQSELRREGARYTPLERMALGVEGKGT